MSKNSKRQSTVQRRASKARAADAKRPKILVLEGLSGAASCVFRAGGSSITVSPSRLQAATEKIEAANWDGLLLTGGGDVDPRLYGQKPSKKTHGVSETRDLVEGYALEIARERGVPVLGICRGNQIMNVEAGGTLCQHVDGHYGYHPVRVSGLLEWIARKPVIYPSSLHHQHVERLAPGFKIVGRAGGVPEAITDGRCLGVQFHPEMDPTLDWSIAIFRWLVCEAARRAGLPKPSARRTASVWEDDGYGYRTLATDKNWVEKSYPKGARTISSPGKAKAKNRPAGTTARDAKFDSTKVRVWWSCRHCNKRFERLRKRDEHEAFCQVPAEYEEFEVERSKGNGGRVAVEVLREATADVERKALTQGEGAHVGWNGKGA